MNYMYRTQQNNTRYPKVPTVKPQYDYGYSEGEIYGDGSY